MHVLKSNLHYLIAVSLTFAVACARDRHDTSPKPGSPPAPAEPASATSTDVRTDEQPATTTPPTAPTPKLTPAELQAEFEVQQHKIDVAVDRLRREHDFYGLDSSWRTRLMAWWPWQKKKDREAIRMLIDEVEVAAERQAEIAHELKNPDLAVRAEVERDRAATLLVSLEEYNAHDHNVAQ